MDYLQEMDFFYLYLEILVGYLIHFLIFKAL